MSYGQLRFLYTNFLDSATITPASQAGGLVGGVEKISGTGEAVMWTQGDYTGTADESFLIQIDSVTAGDDIGLATFSWKKASSTTWDGSGVSTSTTAITLTEGIQIGFTGDGTNDFDLYDTFQFDATALFTKNNLIDRDRNQVFKSGSSFDIVIDLGSPKAVTAFALFDHNLTAAATFKLQANTSSSWSTPPYDAAVTIGDPIILYLSQTYRYWRLRITDASLTYVQIGEAFLGTYLTVACQNAKWGTPVTHGYMIVGESNQAGVSRRKVFTQQRKLSLSFPVILTTDVQNLVTMQQALVFPSTTGKVYPLIIHLHYDEAATCYYMEWTNVGEFTENKIAYQVDSVTMELAEQVKTRV